VDASCHSSGANNFELAPKYGEKLCTPVLVENFLECPIYSYGDHRQTMRDTLIITISLNIQGVVLKFLEGQHK